MNSSKISKTGTVSKMCTVAALTVALGTSTPLFADETKNNTTPSSATLLTHMTMVGAEQFITQPTNIATNEDFISYISSGNPLDMSIQLEQINDIERDDIDNIPSTTDGDATANTTVYMHDSTMSEYIPMEDTFDEQLWMINNGWMEIENIAVIAWDDITTPSNTYPESLEIALRGTWLEGYGKLYYELEQRYGINALFAIGNAFTEVGWDDRAKRCLPYTNRNNIYGIQNQSFNSYDECIRYYFDFMHRLYVKKGIVDATSVSQKYCPPTPRAWRNTIYNIELKLKNKILETVVVDTNQD